MIDLKYFMISLNQIPVITLLVLWLMILVFAGIDYYKKRTLKEYTPITFIVPCYNSEKTVRDTIRSIYESYKGHVFEVIAINDESTDNTLNILNQMKKNLHFRIVNNIQNLGKACSVNSVSKLAKYELLWIIDSDVILNTKAVRATLTRFQYNPKLVAVNSSYRMINGGLLARMQQMECSMMSIVLLAHNHYSAPYLWGGCLAVKKVAFDKVGGFSKNMLTEDGDFAFKLNEHNMHVEHSMVPVGVYSVSSLWGWYKEKIRWLSGTVQCYIKYLNVWIKRPFHVIFLLLFAILSIFFVFSLIQQVIFFDHVWDMYLLSRETMTRILSLKVIGVYSGFVLAGWIFSKVYFFIFSVPYTIPMIKSFRDVYKVFYVIPFVLIYFPALSIIAIMSILNGAWKHICLSEEERAW